MAESYAKAQRNRRDFEKKMKILQREIKLNMQDIKNETQVLNSSLLDVQSKSRNLADTMTFIKQKLLEEKAEAEEQLVKMSIEKSRAPRVNENDGMNKVDDLRHKILHHRSKLDWLAPVTEPPRVKQTVAVMNLLNDDRVGFKGILTRIRATKAKQQQQQQLPKIEQKEDAKPDTPKDVCSLIDHFLSLPKIYPTKPKKKKPEPTVEMIEKYMERAKQREMAMTYSTRRRLKRANHHCKALQELFLEA